MKKKENKLVDVEITEEEIKEEELEQEEEEKNKKKGLIVKVAIFAGCAVLLGGGITTGVLMRKNNISPDNKVIIDVESPIFNDDNTIDVPTVTPIVDELDPVVIGPTIAPDEKDPNEIDPNEIGNGIEQGDDIDEIIEVEPTVVPVEPTVKPEPTAVPTPVPNQGGNGGNDPKEVTPTVTPEPTKAPTPKPTVAPTPTPIVEKDDEYDKAMYDKFIKAGEDFYAGLLKTEASSTYGYKNKKKECLRAIYAFQYIINNKYLTKGTTRKLAEEGFFDPKNLIDDYNLFNNIVVMEVTDDIVAGGEFVNMHNLCLNAEDKKNAKTIIDLINKFTEGSSEVDKESARNFIYANEDDKRTVLPITVSEMEEDFEVFYYVSESAFIRTATLFGLENKLIQNIMSYIVHNAEEIEQSIHNLESIDLSMNKPKVMSI